MLSTTASVTTQKSSIQSFCSSIEFRTTIGSAYSFKDKSLFGYSFIGWFTWFVVTTKKTTTKMTLGSATVLR